MSSTEFLTPFITELGKAHREGRQPTHWLMTDEKWAFIRLNAINDGSSITCDTLLGLPVFTDHHFIVEWRLLDSPVEDRRRETEIYDALHEAARVYQATCDPLTKELHEIHARSGK